MNPAVVHRLQNRDRQKSDLTAKIELTEHRLKMKAETEDENLDESSLYDNGGSNEGMLVAVASTQVVSHCTVSDFGFGVSSSGLHRSP